MSHQTHRDLEAALDGRDEHRSHLVAVLRRVHQPTPHLADVDAVVTAAIQAAPHVPRARRHRVSWKQRLGVASAATALLATIALLASLLLPGHSAAPVSAQELLRRAVAPTPYVSPSRGDAYVSYRARGRIPVNGVRSLGSHLVRIQWIVRNATHFRVDVTTIRPYVDAGTFTVVAQGRTVRAYDSETGVATVRTEPSRGLRYLLEESLVELRIGGGTYGVDVPPDPMTSLKNYLSLLQRDPNSPARVRIVGHQRLHGWTTTVIDMRPAVTAQADACPATVVSRHGHPAQPVPTASRCRVARRGFGRARLWLDTRHDTVLKYQQFGFPTVVNPIMAPANYLYRVRSIHFGPQPERLIHFPFPVRAIRVRPDVPAFGLSENGGSTTLATPHGFVEPPVPAPAFRAEAPQQISYGYGGISRTFGIEQAWFHLTRTLQIRPFPWMPAVPDWGYGPYLDVQERLRPAGLASFYRSGKQVTIGRCQVLTGTYPGGGQWDAIDHHPLTIVLSSGGIPRWILDAYAHSLSICVGG